MFGDHDDYFEIVGNRLKSIREEIGYSQEALAIALEEEYDLRMKQASISKLEMNLNGQIKNFAQILNYYSCEFNYNLNWILAKNNTFISKYNMDVTDLGINQQEISDISKQLILLAEKLNKK
ncbi:MAG: helix-turn-helix domain-containing protein [Flavobacteriales bacterium]